MTSPLGWILASYLVGSVPTSYLAAKWFKGIDLREHGSHNLGATNLYRVLGWRFAVPVGAIDLAKGVIPVVFFGPQDVAIVPYFPMICGIAAVIGHVFSIFVRFRGGKGVATAAGMILALAPVAFLAVLLAWIVLVRATGYVSLGSIVAAALFPAVDYLLQPERRTTLTLVFDLVLAAFIIWKHRSNIQRLLKGTESRFGRRRQSPVEGT